MREIWCRLSNAKLASILGVSESLVSRWKKGERKINPEMAIILGTMYRVSPDKFVFNGNSDLAKGKTIKKILESSVKILEI